MARRKKSNNPFMMIGPYIGAIISFLIYAFYIYDPNRFFPSSTEPILTNFLYTYNLFIFGSLYVIGGFIAGWIIQSVIRRIRK